MKVEQVFERITAQGILLGLLLGLLIQPIHHLYAALFPQAAALGGLTSERLAQGGLISLTGILIGGLTGVLTGAMNGMVVGMLLGLVFYGAPLRERHRLLLTLIAAGLHLFVARAMFTMLDSPLTPYFLMLSVALAAANIYWSLRQPRPSTFASLYWNMVVRSTVYGIVAGTMTFALTMTLDGSNRIQDTRDPFGYLLMIGLWGGMMSIVLSGTCNLFAGLVAAFSATRLPQPRRYRLLITLVGGTAAALAFHLIWGFIGETEFVWLLMVSVTLGSIKGIWEALTPTVTASTPAAPVHP